MFVLSSRNHGANILWRTIAQTSGLRGAYRSFSIHNNDIQTTQITVQKDGAARDTHSYVYRNSSSGRNRQANASYIRSKQASAYSLKMSSLDVRDIVSIFNLASEMKKKKVRPDAQTYGVLLHALALQNLLQETWAAFRDMEAVGITPDIYAFNCLLYAARSFPSDKTFDILQEMDRYHVKPDGRTYDLLISFYLNGGNLELALCYLSEMTEQGFAPHMKTAAKVLEQTANAGYARLALDIGYAFEKLTVRRLEGQTWVKILVACAEGLNLDGVVFCWQKVVKDLHILPDEGLCLQVLHTAARYGKPNLAADVVRQLEANGVQIREYHLSPFLEAFVVNGQLKEAFRVFELMRSSNLTPTVETGSTIVQAIQKDPDTIDGAYVMLEELHKEGQNVDVVAVNLVIQACVTLNDLQRAVGIYKAVASLDVQPNVETYEILLYACRKARHFELGERLFAEMRMAKIKATEKAYREFIGLIMIQDDYERAFSHLEDMKAAGLQPPCALYEDIIRTCLQTGDPRYKLAVDEADSYGYRIDPTLWETIKIREGRRKGNDTLSL